MKKWTGLLIVAQLPTGRKRRRHVYRQRRRLYWQKIECGICQGMAYEFNGTGWLCASCADVLGPKRKEK